MLRNSNLIRCWNIDDTDFLEENLVISIKESLKYPCCITSAIRNLSLGNTQEPLFFYMNVQHSVIYDNQKKEEALQRSNNQDTVK